MLLTGAGTFVVFTPIAQCPEAPHTNLRGCSGCTRCRGEDRVTYWSKWFWKSPPDDPERKAEETFRKIEDQIEKAKSLTVRFTWKGETDGVWFGEGSGTLFLREGGKANVFFKLKNRSGEYKLSLVSDGSNMSWTLEPPGRKPRKETKETPKDLIGKLKLARFGAEHGLFLAGYFEENPQADHLYVKNDYRLSEFRMGEGEAGAKTITYKVMLVEAEAGEATLWYDASTQRPLKRTMHSRNLLSHGGCTTDTFEEFAFDAAIPDEKFKLP